jgi:hypothetical protein
MARRQAVWLPAAEPVAPAAEPAVVPEAVQAVALVERAAARWEQHRYRPGRGVRGEHRDLARCAERREAREAQPEAELAVP